MIWLVLGLGLLCVAYTFYWAANQIALSEADKKASPKKEGWDVDNTLLVVEHPLNKYMVSYKTNKESEDEH